MANTYFTSDTHYGHKNIVKGVSDWEGDKSACRNFDTLEEHNQTLVKNINKTVKYNDILYHLGDWSFGGIENVLKFREQIHCKYIHLLLGNHDHHIKNNKMVYANDKQYYLQSLFESVDALRIETINGQPMVLCHYALRSWDRGSKGTWMLYGHSHGTLPEYTSTQKGLGSTLFKTMDVGLDTWKEFRPYHFDEITEAMHGRLNLNVDHHHAENSKSTGNFRNKFR